ncbi:MAG: universal stress protein [Chloroflexota bacterium]
MGLNILLPLDGSQLSEEALPVARKLAATSASSKIEVLQVVDPSSLGDLTFPIYLKERAAAYVAEQVEALSRHGIDASGSVELGPPARIILNRLEAGRFDYVCMATNGRSGLARVLMGSTTELVIRQSPVPVVAVRPQRASPEDTAWPGDDAAPQELIRLFARGDTLSRQASEVLAGRGNAAVPALLAALGNAEPFVRQYALRTLGSIGDDISLDAIAARLSDVTFAVRWEAAEALIKFQDRGVTAVLSRLTHEPLDARLAVTLAHVLESAPIELHAVLKPVIRELRSAESNISAPIAAAAALAEISKTKRKDLI